MFLDAARQYPQVGNAITDVQDQGGGVFRQEFERAIMYWNGQQVTVYETKGRSASPTSPSPIPQATGLPNSAAQAKPPIPQMSCSQLHKEISDLVEELKGRYYDFIADNKDLQFGHWSIENPKLLFNPDGTPALHPSGQQKSAGSIEGHYKQFLEKQGRLQKALDKWDKDNCGSPGQGDFNEARDWAKKIAPAPNYKGTPGWDGGSQNTPNPNPEIPATSQSPSDIANGQQSGNLVVGAGIGAGIGVGVGASVGAFVGGVIGTVGAGGSCTFVAPGVGTLGCGIAGGLAGATSGAQVGAVVGGAIGGIVGGIAGWFH
jgi:hypothetical protein